jgi:GTP cyclohydrolase I
MIEKKKFKTVPKTPMIDNGLSVEKKKEIIEVKFKEIMETLGLDLSDDSLMDTPKRVAKMYVDEVCKGLREDTFPKITCVQNKFGSQMVTEANITMNSLCEHHFVTICGFAHISYIPKEGGKVIGLSKMNRLVDYWGSRPQVQERLTEQIQKSMCELLEIEDVAVVIDGVHFCVRSRGIKDNSSVTRTSALGGKYRQNSQVREEFFSSIPSMSDFKL